MQLADMHRPRTLDDFVGNPRIVTAVRACMERSNLAGRAFWINGASGTGKSTLAEIIAREVADDFNIIRLIGRKLTIGEIDEIERTARYTTLTEKPGRACIVNEAHGLSRPAVELLHDVLERIPPRFVWIFTTTRDGEEQLFEDNIEAGPLASRVTFLSLTNQGLAKPFAARLQTIARGAGFDLPDRKAAAVVERFKNNLRHAINWLGTPESMDFFVGESPELLAKSNASA